MDEMMRQIAIMFPDFEKYFSAGFIVFARLLGFIRFAPILNRKEINTTVKLSLALLLTMMITPLLNPGPAPASISPMLLWTLKPLKAPLKVSLCGTNPLESGRTAF